MACLARLSAYTFRRWGMVRWSMECVVSRWLSTYSYVHFVLVDVSRCRKLSKASSCGCFSESGFDLLLACLMTPMLSQ